MQLRKSSAWCLHMRSRWPLICICEFDGGLHKETFETAFIKKFSSYKNCAKRQDPIGDFVAASDLPLSV